MTRARRKSRNREARKTSRPPGDSADALSLLDRALEVLDKGPVDNPEPVDVTEAVQTAGGDLMAASTLGTPGDVHQVARAIEDVPEMLLFCIPERWQTEAAKTLCKDLTPDQAAEILTWLTLNWHVGYATGHADGAAGRELHE